MCGTVLRTDRPPPPPPNPPFLPHILEKIHKLARERKKQGSLLFKKKKINLDLFSSHPCVIIYFQHSVPGINALVASVEIEGFSAALWGQVLFAKNPRHIGDSQRL